MESTIKRLDRVIRAFTRRETKIVAYPRTYSNDELRKEIDKYGNESPNSHLGPSYYARASLGLTELERRNSSTMGWFTIALSAAALLFSLVALRYTAEQTRYTELQSRGERIQQLQSIQRAVEVCSDAPDLKESGLFNTANGKNASCAEVLEMYGND